MINRNQIELSSTMLLVIMLKGELNFITSYQIMYKNLFKRENFRHQQVKATPQGHSYLLPFFCYVRTLNPCWACRYFHIHNHIAFQFLDTKLEPVVLSTEQTTCLYPCYLEQLPCEGN